MAALDAILSFVPDYLHPLNLDIQKIDEITFGALIVTGIVIVGTTFAFRKIICKQASILLILSAVSAVYGLLLTRYARKFVSIVDIPLEDDPLDLTIGVLQNMKPVKYEAFQIVSDLILITCIFIILFGFFYTKLPFTVLCNIDKKAFQVIMKIFTIIMVITCAFQFKYQGENNIGTNLVKSSQAGYGVVTDFLEGDLEDKKLKLRNILIQVESFIGIDTDDGFQKSWNDLEVEQEQETKTLDEDSVVL